MRVVDYQDALGRWWKVELPNEANDDNAKNGIPIGPPDVSILNLPLPVSLRLHNELYHRKLYTLKDVFSRPGELQAALQAALKIDVSSLMEIYAGEK